MNAVFEGINSVSANWWSYLFYATWQSSLAAGVLLMVAWLGRRWPSPLRYWLLVLALAKFAVPPMAWLPTGVFSRMGPVVQADSAPGAWEPMALSADAVGNAVAPRSIEALAKGDNGVGELDRSPPVQPLWAMQPGGNPSTRAAPVLATRSASLNGTAWLMLAHLSGMVLVGGWMLCQCNAILRQIRSARVVGEGALHGVYAAVCDRMGMPRRPRLLLSARAAGPVSFGVLRPTILLPAGLAERLSPHELQTVLAHEVAHHRRGDLWINWGQVALTVVWWFHPLVWILNRAIRGAREDCCDDLVLARGLADSDDYCTTLLHTASATLPPTAGALALGFGHSVHPLGRRLRRIMDPALHRSARLSLTGAALVLALSLALLPGLRRGDGRDTAPSALAEPVPHDVRSTLGDTPLRPTYESVADRPPSIALARRIVAATGVDSQAAVLRDYYFHEGSLAGSLRSEVALPVYDADPAHLWNRLFAAFYVRPLPAGPSSAEKQHEPRLAVDANIPVGLSEELLARWRETYNVGDEFRIEGGDVVEAPLLPHPDSLLRDPYFTMVDSVLDEFLESHGERLIEDPLKRALLQRDLWPVFDLLQRKGYPDRSNAPSHRGQYSQQERRRQQALGRKIADAMRRVALSSEQIAALPDTYAEALSSGRFEAEHAFDSTRDYLPPGLFQPDGEWVEIKTRQNGLLRHTDALGFEGRAWFRVFCRFPREAGGRTALVQFIDRERATAEEVRRRENRLFGPDVPRGTQVALVHMMLAIDQTGKIVPTKIVEEVQLRVLEYVDGKEHPDTDSGFGQNLYEYVLRRAALFANPHQGGLRRVPNDEPVRFIPAFPFVSLSSDLGLPSGGLVPLRQACTNCHRHDNRPRSTISGPRTLDPDFPFGKASIRTIHPRALPQPVLDAEAPALVKRVIAWKQNQESFQKLGALWNRTDSR